MTFPHGVKANSTACNHSCPFRKLYPGVLVVKTAKDRV
jgi:hypothetical protein